MIRVDGKCHVAVRFAKDKQVLTYEARDNIVVAQQRMKKYDDQHKRDVQFQIGDFVMLKLMPQI